MDNIQQYQRAVTPTMGTVSGDNAKVRGKMLSYSSRRGVGVSGGVGCEHSSSGSARPQPPSATQRTTRAGVSSGPKSLHAGQNLEISGQSKPVSGNRVSGLNSRQDIYGVGNSDMSRELHKISSYLPHQDLELLSDSVPPDGVLFARFKNRPGSLVVFRLHDERARNPERLNLDRRHLDMCPHLEQEQRLRLLNFQNNNIRLIQNMENLPNLIFLDLYNNKLTTLEGSLSSVRGLRVLMVGKNRINEITNISNLRKLDVLDLHSNDISEIKGLDGLQDLRVLNLAGNNIQVVQNVSMLSSLTELNLRRNSIEHVQELDSIPSLQRVFLSHNHISAEKDIMCLYSLKMLIELSLDANPIADKNPADYRLLIIGRIPSLKHLDLRRVNDDERNLAQSDMKPLSSSSSNCVHDMDKNNETAKESYNSHHQSNSFLELTPHSNDNQNNADSNALDKGSEKVNSVSIPYKKSMTHSQASRSDPEVKSIHPQNAFDLESIDNNEKSLVVVGENWEWAHSKKALAAVSEICLKSIRKETIVGKFAVNESWFPALKSLTLIDNDIKSFSDLNFVIRSFQGHGRKCPITNIVIAQNPVCMISGFLLESYLSSILPTVQFFNGNRISSGKRIFSHRFYETLSCSAGLMHRKLSDLGLFVRTSLDNYDVGKHCFCDNAWTTSITVSGDYSYSAQLLPREGSSPLVAKETNDLSYAGDSKPRNSVCDSSPRKRGDLEYSHPCRPYHTSIDAVVEEVLLDRHVRSKFQKAFFNALDNTLLDAAASHCVIR